jgi:hypothetical protein
MVLQVHYGDSVNALQRLWTRIRNCGKLNMVLQKQRGRLHERVMKIIEEKATMQELILNSWKKGETAREYLLSSPVFTKEKQSEYEKIWRKTVTEYEMERVDFTINDCGVVKETVGDEPNRFDIFYLEHKPSGWHYCRSMVQFSNGLVNLATHYTNIDRSAGGSACGLPWWPQNTRHIEDYEAIMKEEYAKAVAQIEKAFTGKPRVTQKLIASLDEQVREHTLCNAYHVSSMSEAWRIIEQMDI